MKLKIFLIVIASVIGVALASLQIYVNRSNQESADRMRKLFSRSHFVKQGDSSIRQNMFEAALQNYDQAMSDEFISDPDDYFEPLLRKVRLLRYLSRYEEALIILDKAMKYAARPGGDAEMRGGLNVLLRYSQTGDTSSVYKYISTIKSAHENELPPVAYFGHSPIYISSILQSYDAIGDCDSAIAYIDEILAFFRTGKAGNPEPSWVDAEYIKIREAFEKDKAAGTKGSATKAIIQSDYFPW